MQGLRAQVSLREHTTLEIGGPARHYFEAANADEVRAALAWADEHHLPVEVLGSGSNVLIADRGLDALVIRVRIGGIERDGETIEVGAGECWDELTAWAVDRHLAGLECLGGIPGDVGAAPMQNVGAYGQEVSSSIESVHCMKRDGRAVTVPAAECAFAYRDSLFKRVPDEYVILGVRFRLRPNGLPTIAYPELRRAVGEHEESLSRVRDMVIALRRQKSMVLDPRDENRRSAGSFFVNPIVTPAEALAVEDRARSRGAPPMPRFESDDRVKIPAAWLIEQSGLAKGTRRGRVGISTKHCLALVNHGEATASELLAFASEIKTRVRDTFGVTLTPEPRLLGFTPDELAALTP